MKKNLWIIATLVAIAIAGAVSLWIFFIGPKLKPEPELIRVGYLRLASTLSFYVAKEKGYFEQEGLKVEAFVLKSSNEVGDALITSRIDASSIAALSVWLAIEQKSPNIFKIFLMTSATEKTTVHRILVKADSEIQTLPDLKGKTIGTFPGLQMQVFTKLILGQYFDTNDLNLVSLAPPLQKDALASGRVDALFCLEPVGTIAQEAGIARPLAINPLYKYILKPFPTAASVVSTKFLKENPDTAKRYIQAIYRAVDFIYLNPVEARKILPKYTPLDENISQKIGIYDFWKTSQIDRQAVNKLVELYLTHKVLEGRVDTSNIYYEE